MKSLEQLVRPNILQLCKHSSSRHGMSGAMPVVFLDANESPYNSPYNRYPDPECTRLKGLVAGVRHISPNFIFMASGTAQLVDTIYKCFVQPGVHNVVGISPTRSIYEDCARVYGVGYRHASLTGSFGLSSETVLAACGDNTRVVWLCSPNSPTGNSLDSREVQAVVEGFDGIVVIDQAYADFSEASSFMPLLATHPNLIIIDTMSKAWGCASLLVAMAFANARIVDLFRRIAPRFTISQPSQSAALEVLADPYEKYGWVRVIKQERNRMISAFLLLPSCRGVYPTDANFFLAKMTDANAVYSYLISRNIFVRNCSAMPGCDNCLRISVGTRGENNALLAALRQYDL